MAATTVAIVARTPCNRVDPSLQVVASVSSCTIVIIQSTESKVSSLTKLFCSAACALIFSPALYNKCIGPCHNMWPVPWSWSEKWRIYDSDITEYPYLQFKGIQHGIRPTVQCSFLTYAEDGADINMCLCPILCASMLA